VEWAPVRDYKVRGTYQQAVRAPNIIELFTPQGLNLFNAPADPCSGPTPSATLAGCVASGLDPSRYGTNLTNPAGQYNYKQGGNAALKPETAKTYTIGLVMTPLPNLSATVDYWNIKLDDAVGVVPSDVALSSCVTTGQFCNLIHRNPVSGSLWRGDDGFVIGTNVNIASESTDGVDITLNYNQAVKDWGSFGATLVGTWLNSFDTTQVPGLGSYDCAGLYGAKCGTPLPEWRSKLRGTWATPWYNTSLALTWRYMSSVKLDATSSNPLLKAAFDPVNEKLSAQNYIDLAFSWQIDKNFTMYAGCNNLFDKDPPILSSTIAGPPYGNGNTYPQVYDTLGRNLFISLSAKF
jgi:iron complex outermembrane receptor protein